jgi:hypothetical protein
MPCSFTAARMGICAVCMVSPLGVLKGLPGVLLPGLVILLLMGFRSATMGVGGAIVQLGSSLMILVMRSVVIASRHLKALYLPRLVMGFLCKLVSVIRVLQWLVPNASRPLCGIAFFVMFGSRAMGLRRKFVLLGGFPVRLVHRSWSCLPGSVTLGLPHSYARSQASLCWTAGFSMDERRNG